MEAFETRLFDLLETKTFDELNTEETTFVLAHMTEREYRLQQQIMTESSSLDYAVPTPLPLPASPPKVVFLKRSVPLYQALLAAGCFAVLFYMFRPQQDTGTAHYLAKGIDTISIPGPAITIHDTVTQIIEVVRYQEKLVRDTLYVVQSVYTPKQETRMLEGNAIPYPSISSILTTQNSVPLSEDRTASLLPKMVNSGAFDMGK